MPTDVTTVAATAASAATAAAGTKHPSGPPRGTAGGHLRVPTPGALILALASASSTLSLPPWSFTYVWFSVGPWKVQLRCGMVTLVAAGVWPTIWSPVEIDVVHSCLHTVATAVAPSLGSPTPVLLSHVPAYLVAREVRPTRPPRCGMQPRCGCMEVERRLAGPGLGGAAVNEELTKTAGRSKPCHAALTIPTAGDGGEWMRVWRSPWGPPE